MAINASLLSDTFINSLKLYPELKMYLSRAIK